MTDVTSTSSSVSTSSTDSSTSSESTVTSILSSSAIPSIASSSFIPSTSSSSITPTPSSSTTTSTPSSSTISTPSSSTSTSTPSSSTTPTPSSSTTSTASSSTTSTPSSSTSTSTTFSSTTVSTPSSSTISTPSSSTTISTPSSSITSTPSSSSTTSTPSSSTITSTTSSSTTVSTPSSSTTTCTPSSSTTTYTPSSSTTTCTPSSSTTTCTPSSSTTTCTPSSSTISTPSSSTTTCTPSSSTTSTPSSSTTTCTPSPSTTSTPSSSTTSTPSSSTTTSTPSSSTTVSTPSSSSTTSTPSSSTISTPSSFTTTCTPSSFTTTSTPSSSSSTTTASSSTATATVRATCTPMPRASTSTASMAQIPKVVFDDAYKKGEVYVLPPIQKLNVNVYQETNVETPLDPAMPYKTKTHAMQVDEAKLTSGQDKLKGDQDEACVLKLLYEQLQKATHPGDPPVFLFCSLMLSNREKDIVIFHRKYGVIIVEVKGVNNPRSFSRLQKAAEQLLRARDAIRMELQGLLAPDAVTLLMALPNLTDASNARQSMQILRDNPDIQLLYGREEADYKTFLQQLPTRPDPLVWEAQPDSHQAFVTAVSRYVSVEAYSPTETACELAQAHRSWLLTPDQAPVLHRDDRLLHLWGPPGAGKTSLLLHRVKLWLQDNKQVILCVGDFTHSVLLQHLGRASVSGDGGRFSHNLTLCRNDKKFQETVARVDSRAFAEDVNVIVDEVESSFLSPALEALRERKISCLWTASVEDIPDTESARFSSLGGEKVLLPHCLRCPPHVVEVAGKVLQATPRNPAMTSFRYLPATMPTASVKVCFHPSHPGYTPLDSVSGKFDCRVCSKWLKSSLSPLVEDLPLQHPRWRHWVIVYTGNYSGIDKRVETKMVEWLRANGVPAVSEMEATVDYSNLPVSLVRGSGFMDEDAKWRERVVQGKAKDGNDAVHFVSYKLYTGMEKPCVLVLHRDRGDDRPQSRRSTREDRDRRHREEWFRAMTRCQAELCVWILSPSPAVSCLAQSQEERDWCRQEEQRIQEEERQREERCRLDEGAEQKQQRRQQDEEDVCCMLL